MQNTGNQRLSIDDSLCSLHTLPPLFKLLILSGTSTKLTDKHCTGQEDWCSIALNVQIKITLALIVHIWQSCFNHSNTLYPFATFPLINIEPLSWETGLSLRSRNPVQCHPVQGHPVQNTESERKLRTQPQLVRPLDHTAPSKQKQTWWLFQGSLCLFTNVFAAFSKALLS